MEVELKPLSGCMRLALGVFSLGLAPFFQRLGQRNWPKLVDEKGLVTRDGTRIEWNQFTKFRKVITYVRGMKVEHYELRYPKGKVAVVAYRLEKGDQVLDYIWQHVPEQAKQQA